MTYDLHDVLPCENCISVTIAGKAAKFRQGSPRSATEQFVTAVDIEKIVAENCQLRRDKTDMRLEWNKAVGELSTMRSACAGKFRRAELALAELNKHISGAPARIAFKKVEAALK